jgi:hypothetical protein
MGALGVSAHAGVQTNIGTLTCTLAEGMDREKSPPSQTRPMLCSFKPSGTGPEEHYTGEIKNVGSSDTLTGKLVLMWVVMGPDHATFAPGLLEQTYMGKSGAGPSTDTNTPPMLVGDRDETFALRPMNESETDAVNNVTVVSLKIRSTAA